MPTIIGYSLRAGFEPTYSPLQVGMFLPIELPEHIRPFGRRTGGMPACVKQWYLRLDLNQRPTEYESVALPIELHRHKIAQKITWTPVRMVVSAPSFQPFAEDIPHFVVLGTALDFFKATIQDRSGNLSVPRESYRRWYSVRESNPCFGGENPAALPLA